MLLLKRHLVQLVREGRKRQTVRLWTRAAVRAGQISFTPGLGRMKILAVDVLPSLDALTEEDARADGFETLRDLRAEIRKIYGPLGKGGVKGRTLFRIKFEWPIDAAGEELVIAPASGPAPAPAPVVASKSGRVSKVAAHRSASHPGTSRVAAPAGVGSRRAAAMSAVQRKKLRDFIIQNGPGGE
jgi:hypothetical protein